MPGSGVWVLGGVQSDFARNLTKEGNGFADLTEEITLGALDAAGIDANEVEVVHVANAFGQLFTGQGQLGAMPSTVVPQLWGVPASRHEGACASGGLAVMAAMADLESGRYDCALVVGVELEKTVPGQVAAGHLGAATWVGHEDLGAAYPWPCQFDQIATEYDRRYGLDETHLRAIGQLNIANARSNPNAQTRGWVFGPASFDADDDANPVVQGRLRRSDCSQITDGGAAVVVVSDRFLRAHRSGSLRARITGWGHTTVGLALAAKLAHSQDDPYVMPHVRRAITDAFDRAGINGVEDLDGIETHDCFTPSEYLAIDHFGITGPGESWKAIENGELLPGGRIPVNPSGGLIGGGHPVGASGVRMLLDAYRQVTGQAGAYQIEDARRFATLNFGGSTTTTVSMVIGRDDSG